MSNFANIQLSKVMKADLSNYDPTTNTYKIPKNNEIRVIPDRTYLFYLENVSLPYSGKYIIADVMNVQDGVIKVNAVGYNKETNQLDYTFNWGGTLFLKDIKVIEKF